MRAAGGLDDELHPVLGFDIRRLAAMGLPISTSTGAPFGSTSTGAPFGRAGDGAFGFAVALAMMGVLRLVLRTQPRSGRICWEAAPHCKRRVSAF